MTRRLIVYGSAVGLTGAAVGLASFLHGTFDRSFHSVFTIAVMLSAWLGGLGPGLLASVLSATAINYFFQEPRFEFGVGTLGDGIQLVIFSIAAVLLSALIKSRERVRQEATELVHLKSDFVNMVSHDLRTPLASIKGSVELLLDGTTDLSPRQRRFLHTIRRSTERLTRLVTDLLDVARLEAGGLELDLSPRDPRRVIADAVRSLQHEFRAKNQQVRVVCDPDLPWVVVDRHRMEQVLVNLLGNASKYTPERGEVCVSARRVASPSGSLALGQLPHRGSAVGEGRVEISVADTGPGLSPEDQARIFEKFFRGGDRATQSQQSGTGLGLAIALSLVRLHDGELTVHSEPDKGATFCVSLPACSRQAKG